LITVGICIRRIQIKDNGFLFSTNDLPIMEAFDFERMEDYTENNGQQTINDIFKPLLPKT